MRLTIWTGGAGNSYPLILLRQQVANPIVIALAVELAVVEN